MDNVTIKIWRSPLLICCPISFHGKGRVFHTGLCKWVHKSNLYSLWVLHSNLHPCKMVTRPFQHGFLNSWTISHAVTKIYTDTHTGTDVSTLAKSESTFTDADCFKSLLPTWKWTLTSCLCFNSLGTEHMRGRDVSQAASSLWAWPGISKGNTDIPSLPAFPPLHTCK